MSEIILYLFNLLALQASVTPKKIQKDLSGLNPAYYSLQSDFALATNAYPYTAHKHQTLKTYWRSLKSAGVLLVFYPLLDTFTVWLFVSPAFSGAINVATSSMPSSDSVGISNIPCSICSAFSSSRFASPWPQRIPQNFAQIQPHDAGTAAHESEVKAAPETLWI